MHTYAILSERYAAWVIIIFLAAVSILIQLWSCYIQASFQYTYRMHSISGTNPPSYTCLSLTVGRNRSGFTTNQLHATRLEPLMHARKYTTMYRANWLLEFNIFLCWSRSHQPSIDDHTCWGCFSICMVRLVTRPYLVVRVYAYTANYMQAHKDVVQYKVGL
jgi:hypothetical protein